MEYRLEHDTMGEVRVPADRYWGAQTQRSFENFRIGTEKIPPEVIRAFAVVKLAAARAVACAAQRQLDRHRIAALAAGGMPGVTADAAPEPMPPAALAAAFASPEPLDARWPELLRRAAALPACPPPRMTPVQQTCLAQTIVWRHGMDALDDRDVVFPVRYAAATLRLLDCLAAVSGCTDAQLVVLVTREVENDPEALSRLRAGLQIEPKMNAQEALDHEKM